METITQFTLSGAEELVAVLTASDATWTYSVVASADYFLISMLDENEFFVGYL